MRIMIFGRPGSGKSTFALALSHKLGLPLHHVDKYFYTDNWVERDSREFLAILENQVAQENWIIDGNSIRSLEVRYQRADVVIFFCYSRLHCLWRVFKRKFFSTKDCRIDDRAPGCHETLRWKLITYLWSFEDRVKNIIVELRRKYPHVKFYCVRNDRERDEVMKLLTSSF